MSGKDAKRQLRREKEAARAAARRKQRQQSIFTMIVIGIICVIGGVLIYVSAQEPADVAEQPTDLPSGFPTDFPTDVPTEGATDGATEAPGDRAVACGAEAPPNAGQPAPAVTQPEQSLEDGTDYGAVITTSCGRIPVDLLEDQAPETVNNFIALAEAGFFDGREIFRNATSIGALQTGSGNDTASFDLGYTIPDELSAAEEGGYPPGALAMANTGAPDTGGAQFFFVYNERFDEAFAENRTYAVFGRANARGVRVLEEIGAIPTQAPDDPSNEVPSELVYIENVEITTGE